MPSRGKAWELRLEVWHDQYRKRGDAAIWHNHPGVFGKDGKLTYKSAGPPDYTAFLPGRVIVFDAKEVAGTRLPFANIMDHQAVDLEAVIKYGGTAGLMVHFKKHDRPFAWFDWRNMRDAYWQWRWGHDVAASITADKGHPFGNGGWLDVFTTGAPS